ncbi:stage II sporulation protein R [Salipaludibacillus sp. LMS25]|jgi:stage II sporulation protein R|uniref:stage II sporulation protein R n=1 Tax=Salipaludibacillus sp. LMS25 TaxID=2924031 RepID=UPI0020D02E30|nr:stage II sporulation protein R [Salipaludibacillus sp. LMS25]UTR16273.1 stage II sporulation protein R [Salipaludibacillus sp. LMS25]
MKQRYSLIDFKKRLLMALYSSFIVTVCLLSWEAHFFYPQYEVSANVISVSSGEESGRVEIPEEAIRLRIKSNSQSPEDQQLKLIIRNDVNRYIRSWTEESSDVEEAREMIKTRLPELEDVIKKAMMKADVFSPFTVDLKEVDFPTKQYGERIYPAGNYEAVYIEIGEGLGDNWWCVLFPPLCFIDSGNEEANVEAEEGETDEDVDISFFLVEVIESLWAKLTA